jgi:hypothetical protein
MGDEIHLHMLEEEFIKNINFNFPFNANENDIPFGYTKFIDKAIGSVFWICSKDEHGKITSIFFNSCNRERHITYLESINKAVEYKNTLIQDGWVPIKPKIQFSFKQDDGNSK